MTVILPAARRPGIFGDSDYCERTRQLPLDSPPSLPLRGTTRHVSQLRKVSLAHGHFLCRVVKVREKNRRKQR